MVHRPRHTARLSVCWLFFNKSMAVVLLGTVVVITSTTSTSSGTFEVATEAHGHRHGLLLRRRASKPTPEPEPNTSSASPSWASRFSHAFGLFDAPGPAPVPSSSYTLEYIRCEPQEPTVNLGTVHVGLPVSAGSKADEESAALLTRSLLRT